MKIHLSIISRVLQLCLVIVLALHLVSCSSNPPESVVSEMLTASGYPNVRIVEYGSTLVSEGYKAPKGTKLYPVKVTHTFNSRDDQDVFYFYRDEFGKWQWYIKR